MTGDQKRSSKIRVRISKIQFPEVCPVCLVEPEDLVFVTIMEKFGDDYTSGSWASQQDKTAIALNAAKGAITFAIPTCMKHGSKSVRSLKTKLIAAIGFFVLFYPILFFLLQINVALTYSGPILPPLLGTLVTSALLVMIIVYSLFPRALERAIRFHDVSRAKDSVLLSLSNPEYSRLFLDLNVMTAERVEHENAEPVD